MKIGFTFILILFGALNVTKSQNLDLRYIDDQGVTHNYVYENINSDYGPRIVSTGSFYHPGIDLNLVDIDDFGFRILTPVAGTIMNLQRSATNNFTYITIDGPDNENYGFGHLFDEAGNSSGNFTLKLMNSPHETVYCIVDHNDPQNITAIGMVVNGTVRYKGVDYPVSNTVLLDQPIGPIGNSGPGGTHLHLYLLRNAAGSLRDLSNAKNPVQYLYTPEANPQLNFGVEINSTNNLTMYPPNLYNFFDGTEFSSIKTRISLPDEGENAGLYDISVMDIEKVALHIKKFNEDDSKYVLMKGDRYNLELNLGGVWNGTLYPPCIRQQTGDDSRTGIYPYAYNNSNPHNYDDYYFSDFVTRIHKDDGPTQTQYAFINKDAYYKDGVYTIKPKVFRVTGTEIINNETDNIIIDNFCPYVERVKVREDIENSSWKYSRGWVWANNTLTLEPGISNRVNGNYDIVINITMSEPLLNMGIAVGSYSTTLPTYILDKWIWEFKVPKEYLIEGENTIRIWGEDVNHNQIQINPVIIPIRGNNGNWSPARNGGEDTWHKFLFTSIPIDFTFQQTGQGTHTIEFKDDSQINGLSYSWEFGDNIYNGTAYTKDAVYDYPCAGVYLVKHGMDNYGSMVKEVSVQDLPTPVSNFNYSPNWNNGGRSLIDVDFYSDASGIIYSYYWDFDGCGTSTEENPKGIQMEERVPYDVSLTVQSGTNTDTYISEVYIDPDTNPIITIIPFQLSYFMYDFQVCTYNFDETYPKTYFIDFGDGTSTEVISDDDYYNFNHEFFQIGIYEVITTVTQKINGNIVSATSVKEIRVYPDYLDVSIFQEENTNPYPLINFKFYAQIQPPADYYGAWYIYKLGDPTFYYTENFTSQLPSLPELDYNFSSTGEYLIGINVSTSGLPSAGHAALIVNVINAPDYIDAFLSGPSLLTTNTSGTFFTSLFPIGDPGVPDANWWTTNLRWRLYKKNNDGSYTKIEDIQDPFQNYMDARYLHARTFNFESEGEYKLILEAWNNTHGYITNTLGPKYINTYSYYDLCEKIINVSNSFPSLTLLLPDPDKLLQQDGSDSFPVQFTNRGTDPINWSIEVVDCSNCIVSNYVSNGIGLNNNEVVSCELFPTVNSDPDNREILIKVRGTINGIDVEGSPSYFFIEQYGTNPPEQLVLGDFPFHLFGTSVSIDDMTAIVGAPSSNPQQRGVAYVYKKNNLGLWIRTNTLQPSDNNLAFGGCVDIHGDYIVVTGEDTEKTYVYRKNNGSWGPYENKIIYNIIDEDELHDVNLSIWGDYLAIGYPNWEDKGIVLIYNKNQGGIENWGEVKRFFGNWQSEDRDHFGSSVELYNDKLVVGASGESWNSGYLNIYNRNKVTADDWAFVDNRLAPQSEQAETKFGQRVSIFDNAVTTSYRYVDAWISEIDVPIYITDDIGNIIDEYETTILHEIYTNWDMQNDIKSISLYKDVCYESGTETYEVPPLIDYRAYMGYYSSVCTAGISGFAFFDRENHFCRGLFDNPLGYNHEYPNIHIGNSVANNHYAILTGIPGYYIDNAYGAVHFENWYSVENKNQAGIKIHYVNFTKPSGDYGTIEANRIIIGGRNFPAVFQPGVNISYNAHEITLDKGFLADRGVEFVAKAETSTPKNNAKLLVGKSKDNKLSIRSLYAKYPNFPWHTFNPMDLRDLNKSILEKKSESTKQDCLILQLPNLDKLLILNDHKDEK